MTLKTLFQLLGLDEKDCEVFTTLYKLGTNPASVIANHAGLERTTTYRLLKGLKKLGIVSSTIRQGMQMFFVENEDTLLRVVRQKKKELEQVEESYDMLASELKNLRPEALNPPKIKIYDDPVVKATQKNIFQDIFQEIETQGLTTIRLIASNSFQEQIGPVRLKEVAEIFLKDLEKRQIKVDALIAEGMLTRERLERLEGLSELFLLPASNGATNIYIVGDTVFIILFRENTIGVQLSHPDIAQMMHFMFDQMKK